MPEPPKPTDYQFEGSETYKGFGEDKFTIKQTVMKQLQKCLEEGSKEMTSGGVVQRVVNGVLVEHMLPNQKEIFCNACDMLCILVLPQMKKYPDVVKDFLDDFEEKLEDSRKKREDKFKKIEDEFKTKGKADDYIKSYNKNMQMITNIHEVEKITIYKEKLLTAISFLLYKINYFEETSRMGGK